MRVSELARLCGVSPQAVQKWRWRGMPPKHAIKVEAATRGEVMRFELRPDVYPPPGAGRPLGYRPKMNQRIENDPAIK